MRRMATAAQQSMTGDQLFALPSDGMRYELIRGELAAMSPVGFEHGKIVFRLGGILERFVSAAGVGELVGSDVGFYLERDPDTVRAPDIAFLGNAKLKQIADRTKFVNNAPDLAVEVVSPSDSLQAIEEKAEAFLEAGTKLVWVVNPRNQRVWVYQRQKKPIVFEGEDVLEAESLIPGLRIPVREIFA